MKEHGIFGRAPAATRRCHISADINDKPHNCAHSFSAAADFAWRFPADIVNMRRRISPAVSRHRIRHAKRASSLHYRSLLATDIRPMNATTFDDASASRPRQSAAADRHHVMAECITTSSSPDEDDVTRSGDRRRPAHRAICRPPAPLKQVPPSSARGMREA